MKKTIELSSGLSGCTLAEEVRAAGVLLYPKGEVLTDKILAVLAKRGIRLVDVECGRQVGDAGEMWRRELDGKFKLVQGIAVMDQLKQIVLAFRLEKNPGA